MSVSSWNRYPWWVAVFESVCVCVSMRISIEQRPLILIHVWIFCGPRERVCLHGSVNVGIKVMLLRTCAWATTNIGTHSPDFTNQFRWRPQKRTFCGCGLYRWSTRSRLFSIYDFLYLFVTISCGHNYDSYMYGTPSFLFWHMLPSLYLFNAALYPNIVYFLCNSRSPRLPSPHDTTMSIILSLSFSAKSLFLHSTRQSLLHP